MHLLKKMAARAAVASLLALGLFLPCAWATTIGYHSVHLGGTQWRNDYTVTNDTLAVPIEEFTIFFDNGLYATLVDASTASGWDILVIQPDGAIPAAGFMDALALAGGIAPGASLGGFSIIFDYLGTGTPPPQAFSIVDPVTFAQIDGGFTTRPGIVPAPSTPWLMLAGLIALLRVRRRAAGALTLATVQAALLATALTACNGSPGRDHEVRQVAMAASVVTLAGPFDIVGLEKVAEQRVNRTTFDYTFRVSIRNAGTDSAANVVATVTGTPAGATIVEGIVNAGTIAAGATVSPADTIVLRIDRTMPFDPAGLVWDIQQDAPVRLEPVRPAEVYVLPLADLGFPDGADGVTVTGAITAALIKDGTLRFATPGDTGEDQEAQFHVTHGGATTTLIATIRTQLPTAVEILVDPNDDGSLPEPAPRLIVGGLGANNVLRPGALSFRLEGTAVLDLADDSDGLVSGPGGVAISLKDYWTFDPADGSFTIAGAALEQLRAQLPPGALTMSVNFVSKDGEFAATYELIVIHASATMTGQLVDSQDFPVTSLAGRTMLLAGFNNRLRMTATIDANGAFTFHDLIPDTYQVTLSDLENPNVVSVSALVFNDSTNVDVTVVYPFGAPAPKARGMMQAPAGRVTQDGTAPPRRSVPGQAPAPAPLPVHPSATSETFTATAAAQNQTITTPIQFNVPQGTKNVEARITVFTAEYPVFTTAQSQYNDTWSYAVLGLPGAALSAAGAVNQSHFTQGTVTKTECVDVTAQAKNAPFAVTGSVSATNIGDGILPTTTTVTLSLECTGLKVTLAKATSPNKDAHPVLQPISLVSNLPGPYLSVPETAPIATHTFPLEVQYAPASADITEVNIGVSPNAAAPGFAAENLLTAQAHTKTPGKIKFTGIVLPAYAAAMGNGKVVVTVRIKGKVAGTDAESDPAEGGQVTFAPSQATAFIPLSLAGNDAALAGRRYGVRDAGGDSWATRQTIDWLKTKAYRFDDISGQHVTQTAAGRSILNHAGHSDGQQIDMRYADGTGGFTDPLGGAGNGAQIKKLIDDAAAEVAAGAPVKPRLALLVAWINANRAMLDIEAAAGATRIIHIGPSFIKLALVDGKFSAAAGAAIPGVAPWVKPAKVNITPGHLHHWHLSLTAHP